MLSEEMLQEKGTMIFRDAFMVRCFEYEKEQILNESIISIRERGEIVTIEVFLHKLPEKIQISSRISQRELYGTHESLSL